MSTGLVLEKAVQGMCARLAVNSSPLKITNEIFLWKRLVECILSSQVSYASAQVATQRITSILFSSMGRCEEILTDALINCLLKPMTVCGKTVRYRFPRLKSKQVALTWSYFEANAKPLASIVYSDSSENELRDELIDLVSGLGLKQASMFLRDVGAAKNLAIIDRHVIDFMEAVHLSSNLTKSLNTKEYLELENSLRDYAFFLGYSLDILDRAVWLVTRAAKRERIL